MQFNIQESVNFILDTSRSSRLRAIELFTFLVVLHLGASRASITGHHRSGNNISSLVLEIPTKVVRTAKVLSAMKFLDGLEKDWKTANNENSQPLMRQMLEVPEFEEIITETISATGSWYKLRFVRGLRDFEGDLIDAKIEAGEVARIIEFSFRFVSNPKKPKHLGGVTMATKIVASQPYFKMRTQDSQLEAYWAQLKGAAPFFYLIYVQKYPLELRKIAGRNFAERFLRMISDQDGLLEFFLQYNFIVDALRQRGYRYNSLQLPSKIEFKPISQSAFSSRTPAERDVLKAIDAYPKRPKPDPANATK